MAALPPRRKPAPRHRRAFTGQWITGIGAAIWIAGVLIGMFLAVPRLKLLRKVFTVKWPATRAMVLFDLHRTVGLVSGVLLIVTAFTGLYMNLPAVMEPALAAVAPFTERPASLRPVDMAVGQVWQIGWDEAVKRARAAHAADPIAGVGKIEARGYYQVSFLSAPVVRTSRHRGYICRGIAKPRLGKWLHPMRVSHYMWSEKLNPWMVGVAAMAAATRAVRQPVDESNLSLKLERQASEHISDALDRYRKFRDSMQEAAFRAAYG